MSTSTRRRKRSPTSDSHGVPESRNNLNDQGKRCRLDVPDKEAKVLLDENGIAILEGALLRVAEEARERQETSKALKEIAE